MHYTTIPDTNMRRSFIYLLLLALISSCYVQKTDDYYITLFNNSNDVITYGISFEYPKDTLSFCLEHVINPLQFDKKIFGGEKVGSWKEYLLSKYAPEYISIFILDGCVERRNRNVYNYPVYKDIIFLARYDLTLEDFESLGWKITYPPSDNMKTVNMFPPYSSFVDIGKDGL